jgi:hypothetical protein
MERRPLREQVERAPADGVDAGCILDIAELGQVETRDEQRTIRIHAGSLRWWPSVSVP